MREPLFRGKRVDNDEWVCDNSVLFFAKTTKIYGALNKWREIEVKPETVGQFTNLADKNGNKIFEGDIVKSCFRSDADKEPMTVEFRIERGGWFPFACGDGCGCCEVDTYPPEYTEIIGNIYDNPELIEGARGCL